MTAEASVCTWTWECQLHQAQVPHELHPTNSESQTLTPMTYPRKLQLLKQRTLVLCIVSPASSRRTNAPSGWSGMLEASPHEGWRIHTRAGVPDLRSENGKEVPPHQQRGTWHACGSLTTGNKFFPPCQLPPAFDIVVAIVLVALEN